MNKFTKFILWMLMSSLIFFATIGAIVFILHESGVTKCELTAPQTNEEERI